VVVRDNDENIRTCTKYIESFETLYKEVVTVIYSTLMLVVPRSVPVNLLKFAAGQIEIDIRPPKRCLWR